MMIFSMMDEGANDDKYKLQKVVKIFRSFIANKCC